MLTTLDEYGGYHGAWVSSGNSRGLETGDSDSEDDDYDDIAYGTMARFVPTLVLERLRAEGEASRSRGSSGGASSAPNLSASDKAEGPNIPQVCSNYIAWVPRGNHVFMATRCCFGRTDSLRNALQSMHDV